MTARALSFFLLFAATSATAETVAFRNVNVLPMTSDKVLAKQTVLVENDRITAVGPSNKVKVPKGAKVVDGSGKYLLPGLAEMHGHIPPPNAPADVLSDVLFEYVAAGITTVRGMLGHPGQLELREKQKRGEILAPNLYLAGPSFNGQSINSPQEAIDKVRQQKKEGWDLLKVHPGLTREEYDAMARTAKEEGIRFGGHVPAEVGLLHALASGQETFDHIDGYAEYLEADKPEMDAKKLADIVQRTKAAGAWIVPTSALWEVLLNAIDLQELQAYDELKYVPKQTVDQWSKLYNDRLSQLPRETGRTIVQNRNRILRALNEGGVKILMGTDAPQQFSVPGFSLHRELLRMRQAGMTPYQILVSGTRNVGEYFQKTDSFGTVEPGKRADLILADANPLADIGNIARISGVMVRGRWVPKSEIEARLKQIELKYRR